MEQNRDVVAAVSAPGGPVGTILAFRADGQVWKTTDHGANWSMVRNVPTSLPANVPQQPEQPEQPE